MTTITESDYNAEVEAQAQNLAEAAEDTGESPLNLIADVLDAHSWFNGELTGADFGAIISDYNEFGGNPENYRDPSTLTTGGDFSDILRKMAFAEFEADVLVYYENQH